MDPTSNREVEDSPDTARKPYRKPKLEIYGDLRAITQGNAAGAKADGMAGAGMQKTN
jgi:hypothetical protein